MLMVLTYSFFVFNLYGKSCHVENTTDSKTLENEEVGMPLHMEIVWYLLLFMLSVFTTKELLQFIASPKSYLRIGENYAQVLFIILAIMTIFPFPLGPISVKGGGNLCKNLKPGGFMQYLNIYGLAAVSSNCEINFLKKIYLFWLFYKGERGYKLDPHFVENRETS